MNGVLFDLKEFAVYDGPGIRQTVFMKGCPLRCNWCHNPEGLESKPQLMVSHAACIHCGKCTEICEHSVCTACGKCVAVCPLGLRSISGEIVSSSQLAERILLQADYYAALGGGVTFSGGEPLAQGEFLLEVLDRLQSVHCAIETSGYAESTLFEEVIRKMQFVMMDLKVIDPSLHQKYTNVCNTQILNNLKILCEADTPFVIRIPIIPGVNDNEKNYRDTASLLVNAKQLCGVELLPYHQTAGAKYAMLGKVYEPQFCCDQPVQISEKIFNEYKIRSKVL